MASKSTTFKSESETGIITFKKRPVSPLSNWLETVPSQQEVFRAGLIPDNNTAIIISINS